MMNMRKITILLSCLFLGSMWGLFAHSYFLIDFFPITSRRLVAVVVIVILSSSIFHYYAFIKFFFPSWSILTNKQRFFSVLSSLILGAWIFFADTHPWTRAEKYILPLLPTHRLELFIEANGEKVENSSVLLCCFKTSVEEVSFSQTQYQGWERTDKFNLKLTSWDRNILVWSGYTAESVQLQFTFVGDSDYEITLLFKWDDEKEERVNFKGRQFSYKRRFNVPWFASKSALLFLGTFLLAILIMPLYVTIWRYFPKWHSQIECHLTHPQKPFDRKELGWLLGIWLLALILRGFYLECLPPYADEYFHLLAAKNLFMNEPIQDVYQRSLWITTIPVFLSFRLFGPAIWSARLPGVIVNSLAIFPLYWLMRSVNSWVAFASVILFATSPWIVATSRYVREYAYHPFYFYLIVSLMIVFLQKIIKREWKKIYLLLGSVALSAPVIYGIFIDEMSTFKVLLIAYAVFSIFLAWKVFDLPLRILQRFHYILLLTLIASFLLFLINLPTFTRLPISSLQKHITLLSPEYLYRLGFFLLPSAQQWYFQRTVLFIAPIWIAAICFSFISRRHTFTPLYIFSLFSSYFIILVFWLNTPLPRPRYLIYVQIWYIPFLAIGIYSAWHFISTFLKQRQALFLVLLAGILSINPIPIMHPFLCKHLELYTSKGKIYITEENKYEVSSAHRFILENASSEDALVAVEYAAYVKFLGKPVFSSILIYRAKSFRDLIEFAKQYPSGWIVLDASRISKEFPSDESVVDDIYIQYMGKFDDFFIWKWKKR